MKSTDWRYLLICLMLACVPLQGMAALGLLSCHTEQNSQQFKVPHVNEVAMHDDHAAHSTHHDHEVQSSSALEHTHAPCCTGVALLFPQISLPGFSPCACGIPSPITDFASAFLDFPERPPIL